MVTVIRWHQVTAIKIIIKFLTFSRPPVTCSIFQDFWAQAGLIDGYWSTEVKYVKLEQGIEYNFWIAKHLMKRLNLHQDCLDESEVLATNYNFHKCADNCTQSLLQTSLGDSGQKLCWIPQADYYMRLLNLTNTEACQTLEEMAAVSSALTQAMSKGSKCKDCLPICSYPSFNIEVAESIIYQPGMENITEIFLQWKDSSVTTYEEYQLMDFNAIVSAVGGSLGIFLGFSCLQLLLQLVQKFEAKFC